MSGFFISDNIDFERLRKDLYEESLAAVFGGGFGGAFLQAEDVMRASDSDLVKIAVKNGMNINDYIATLKEDTNENT